MIFRTTAIDKSYPGIEVLRFFSALAVLVWHFQHFAYGASGFSIERSEQPFYTLLEPFYLYGAYGVQLFWCISGFVFFHVYRVDHVSRGGFVKSFWVKRFARLYPLHLFTLLLVLLLQWFFSAQHNYYFVYQHNDWEHLLLQLFMISHWGLQEGYSYNGPIWSVSLEIVAYLLFFIWCITGKWKKAVLGLSLAALYWWEQYVILECILLFFMGGVVHYMSTQPNHWLRSGFTALLVLSGAWLLWISQQAGGLYAITPAQRASLIMVLSAFTVLVASQMRITEAARHLAFMLGNLTYSIYLIHFPVQLTIVLLFTQAGASIDYRSGELFALYMLATLLSAGITCKYIELPARRIIRKYS